MLGKAVENALGPKAGVTKTTVEALGALTALWMDGAPLIDLQVRINSKNRGGTCTDARRFVMRSVPEISYAIGLIVQIFRERQDNVATFRMPLIVGSLAACVREGVNSPELFAAHFLVPPPASRAAIRERLAAATSRLRPAKDDETFADTRRRVRDALRI